MSEVVPSTESIQSALAQLRPKKSALPLGEMLDSYVPKSNCLEPSLPSFQANEAAQEQRKQKRAAGAPLESIVQCHSDGDQLKLLTMEMEKARVELNEILNESGISMTQLSTICSQVSAYCTPNDKKGSRFEPMKSIRSDGITEIGARKPIENYGRNRNRAIINCHRNQLRNLQDNNHNSNKANREKKASMKQYEEM
jgi:hypothetical protein